MSHELVPKQSVPSTGTDSEPGTPAEVQAVFNRLLPEGLSDPDQIAAAMKLAAGINDSRPYDFDND